MTSNLTTTTWEHSFTEPCTISNITLNNTTHNKLKYWTYTCDLTNGYAIKWSMTSTQQCCESYSTFIGNFPDRDSVQCTEYNTNIQDIRNNTLAVVSRNQSNFNCHDHTFRCVKIISKSEVVFEQQACGNQPFIKATSWLIFGNARLDPVQLGMQCIGRYPHNALLELVSPTGEIVYEKTFILY